MVKVIMAGFKVSLATEADELLFAGIARQTS
jgi:hypothetical protein